MRAAIFQNDREYTALPSRGAAIYSRFHCGGEHFSPSECVQVHPQVHFFKTEIRSTMSGILKFAVLTLMITGSIARSVTKYRAGIVEFKPRTTDRSEENELKNAWEYYSYAEKASNQSVDILVFPEYGLTGLPSPKRNNNQTVPKVNATDLWNPCLNKDRYSHTEVLHILSCASRNNSIAIVANLLSKEACDNSTRKCPEDGFYQFNTNVVIDKNGAVVARYHKYHLFGESHIDHPEQPEYVTFDLGFGNMGTFVCFDIMYNKPAVDLIENYDVRHVLFPTAWQNELPYYTAPQWFARFAYGMGVNVVAANYFYPSGSFIGSGIFSSTDGARVEAWDISKPGQMLFADIPINPPEQRREFVHCAEDSILTNSIRPIHQSTSTGRQSCVYTNIPSSTPTNTTHKICYEPKGEYSYTLLEGENGDGHVCNDDVCCRVEYEFNVRDDHEIYVLAARNANKTVLNYSMGVQVCAVLYCTSEDIESCGNVVPSNPKSRFSKLNIRGKFDTKYIFPDVFSTSLNLVSTEKWEYSKKMCLDSSSSLGEVNLKSTLDEPLLVASILGRMYEWDSPVQ